MHARNAIAGAARLCKYLPLKLQKNLLFQTVHGSEGYSPAKNGAISAISEALTGKTFYNFSRDGFNRDFSSYPAAKNPDSSENDEDFDNNYTQATSSIQRRQKKKNKSEIFSRDDANKVGVGGPGFKSRVVKGKGKDKFRDGKNDSGNVKDKSSKLKGEFRNGKNDFGHGKDKSSRQLGKFQNGKNDSGNGKDKSLKPREKFEKKEIEKEEEIKDKPKEKFAKKKIDWEELEKEEERKEKSSKRKERIAKKEIDCEERKEEEEEEILNSQMLNNCNIDELLPSYSSTERQKKAANVANALASLILSHGNDNDVSESSWKSSSKKVKQERNKEQEDLEKVLGKIANKLEEGEEEEEMQQSGMDSNDWIPLLSPEEKLGRSSRLAKSLLEASLEGPDDEEEEEEQEYIRREEQRSLTVGIIGPPNSGKSTLTNFMVGKKVAAVSRKTNTTTREILGALTKGDTQILFFDTPGIGMNNAGYPSKTDVRQRSESSWSSVELYDLLVVIIDAHRHLEKPDPRVRKLVNQVGQEMHPKQKRILCMNKVDLVKEKKDLLKVATEFGKLPGYDKFYMISGIKGSGVKDLLKYFMEQAVRRPWDEVPWDEDPMKLDEDILKSTALEVVREKMLHYIHEEIPYEIDHRLIDWKEMEDGSLRIEQHFIVYKHTHRRIIVGKHGSKIREIGMAANEELRSLFKRTIHLMIQVRLKS